MKEFETLFAMRNSLLELENSLGIGNFNETEKSILEYIISHKDKDIALKDILNNSYFKEKSEATIKRALDRMIKSKIVVQEFSEHDRRKRILNINFTSILGQTIK